MGKLSYQGGGYALSTLRSYLSCDGGGFTNASSMRSAFTGYSGAGAMSFAMDSWINSRCWRLTVYSGSGTVAVTSPWYSGYSNDHEPAQFAVTSNNNVWVTIDASPSSNYAFQYWYRQDPAEVWSYSANTSYYVPTAGWENTSYIGASFYYSPPPPPPSSCYYYQMQGDYYGADCNGFSQYGWSYNQQCMLSVDYGGYQSGGSCGSTCTVKGTSIEMADGTTKLIEKIRVGDILKGMKISDAPEDDTIIGWSTDTLNLIETEVVVMGIRPYASQRIHNFNNGLIETSESHAHFIKRGNDWSFKQARNIQVGDFLVDKDGNSIEITSIDVSQGEDRKIVYSMDVEDNDTYIANGLITHNPAPKLEEFQ